MIKKHYFQGAILCLFTLAEQLTSWSKFLSRQMSHSTVGYNKTVFFKTKSTHLNETWCIRGEEL